MPCYGCEDLDCGIDPVEEDEELHDFIGDFERSQIEETCECVGSARCVKHFLEELDS